MATTNVTSLSIADIEKQIAKIVAEIEKVRAQELIAAEKSLVMAEKAAAAAQATLIKFIASGANTPAAKARLTAAKEACANHGKAVTIAQQTVALLTAKNKAAEKFAKKVAKTLAKANKGKRTKEQKKLDKKAKKAKKNNDYDKKAQATQPATKPAIKKVKSEEVKANVDITSKTKPTASTKVATKPDKATEANLPMTAPAKDINEEVTIPSSVGIRSPERSYSIEVPVPNADESVTTVTTNIEQPNNNSDV